MPAFVRQHPLEHAQGSFFSYSSGTTVWIARIWQNAVGDAKNSLNYLQRTLFGPLDMRTAVMEADARGNFCRTLVYVRFGP